MRGPTSSRLSAAIEQSHDGVGIVWPVAIAPYEVEILPLNMDSERVVQVAESLYDECRAAGLETLLDDRSDRAGSKFADADLVGIPHRIVVGEKALKDGFVEIAARRSKSDVMRVGLSEAVARIRDEVEAERDAG